MTKIKIEIKNRWTGSILFSYEKEDNTLRDTVIKAYNDGADLRGADLTGADLTGAVLTGAVLRSADLTGADLRGADLRDAVLTGADLRDADLRGADLTPIKDDFFAVLLRSIPELQFLKKNIIEGKIDGSTYDGECACLSGTLANGAKLHNGPMESVVIKNIMSCRNSSRPIEMFFLNIKKGETPDTNPFSKLAFEWLEEFEAYLLPVTA